MTLGPTAAAGGRTVMKETSLTGSWRSHARPPATGWAVRGVDPVATHLP